MILTRQVRVGHTLIGGNAPVSVQTMYNGDLAVCDDSLKSRFAVLKATGCDIMRVSYPDLAQHGALCDFVSSCPMDVVADIHFDYKNALDSLDCNVAGIRINPGNIGAKWKTTEIVKKAADKGVCIRIGLNSGSLPENKEKKDVAALMTNTALEYISWFEKENFFNTVVSLKATDEETTVRAYELFAKNSNYPLHLGLTEAGGAVISAVRSTWVMSRLLQKGIGNTIRYSMSSSMEDEVIAGVELLRTMGLRKGGVKIVSCPTCNRKSFDSIAFLNEVQKPLLACGKNITVAIMGCVVNGPGEAKNADVAVCGIGNKIMLYKKGVLYDSVKAEDAKDRLLSLIEEL